MRLLTGSPGSPLGPISPSSPWEEKAGAGQTEEAMMNDNGRKANMCSTVRVHVCACVREYGDMKENRGRQDQIASAAGNQKSWGRLEEDRGVHGSKHTRRKGERKRIVLVLVKDLLVSLGMAEWRCIDSKCFCFTLSPSSPGAPGGPEGPDSPYNSKTWNFSRRTHQNKHMRTFPRATRWLTLFPFSPGSPDRPSKPRSPWGGGGE